MQRFGSNAPALTMASGPSTIYPEVRVAMAQPMMHHRDPKFTTLMHSVTDRLTTVFKTTGSVLPIEGEAILGLEMAAYNLVKPGDVCINVVTGIYGAGYTHILEAYGATVIEVAAPYNSSVTLGMVEDVMDRYPQAKILSVVHSETPSATENPIQQLCLEARKRGMLSIVDSVSGIGGSDVRVDEWGIDICVTGTQKCLSCSPGMTLVSVSEQAWKEIVTCQRYDASYLSFKPWKHQWLDHDYLPYTPAVSLVYGLDEALDILLEEGVDKAIARHATAARAVRSAIIASGLELWVDDESHAANSITALKIPDGVDEASLRSKLNKEYGLYISGGLGEMSGKLLRIGHMGATATRACTLEAFSALGSALSDIGHPINMGTGLDAMRAVWNE